MATAAGILLVTLSMLAIGWLVWRAVQLQDRDAPPQDDDDRDR